MFATMNGCVCSHLANGVRCISCRGRDEAFERHGKRCRNCDTKLFDKGYDAPDDSDSELAKGLCTKCYYDWVDGVSDVTPNRSYLDNLYRR